ncbi:protein-L-isoaspartate O-methyltransferase [Mucidula mucida]|nr:protein-L-isoaspartate O-methyltransferase [Mucidula mucida]
MAWRCTGKTNVELVNNMASSRIIKADSAMAKVDRANYVVHKAFAYEDSPQVIGHGATISAPHMHAYAAEHLLPYIHPGSSILDVGSGSGYWLPKKGKVIGIEHIPELTEWSEANLRNDGLADALDPRTSKSLRETDVSVSISGRPYDAIHVGAAAPTLPEKLVEQLASPGRMFIPIGTHFQKIFHIDKDEHGKVTKTEIMDVRYVPLTDREAQE